MMVLELSAVEAELLKKALADVIYELDATAEHLEGYGAKARERREEYRFRAQELDALRMRLGCPSWFEIRPALPSPAQCCKLQGAECVVADTERFGRRPRR